MNSSEDTPNDAAKVETSNFVLCDPEFELVMPWPLTKPDVYVKHLFRQSLPPNELMADEQRLRTWQNPDDESIQRLLDSIQRDTEIHKRGREIFSYEEDKAYADHFTETIASSASKEIGDSEFKPLTDEEIAGLRLELKAESVRHRYESDCRVDGARGRAALFEGNKEDEIVVHQFIGDPVAPAFKIDLVWKRPGGERRLRYRNDTSKMETQREGRTARRRGITDIKPAIGMAREYFVGARQGLDITRGVPYEMGNPLHWMLFLKIYNKLWLVDAVDALVDSFQQPARD